MFYVKRGNRADVMIIASFRDDLLLAGNGMIATIGMKAVLTDIFYMQYLSKAMFCLGLEIIRV